MKKKKGENVREGIMKESHKSHIRFINFVIYGLQVKRGKYLGVQRIHKSREMKTREFDANGWEEK